VYGSKSELGVMGYCIRLKRQEKREECRDGQNFTLLFFYELTSKLLLHKLSLLTASNHKDPTKFRTTHGFQAFGFGHLSLRPAAIAYASKGVKQGL